MTGHAIFISYRRDDTADQAGRIYDWLVREFQTEFVFKDVDSLPFGTDFGAYIGETLDQCRIVLVLVGPHWLERQGNGSRRVDDPEDWVRLEVERALGHGGVQVIPVLVNGAAMPPPTELPPSLRPLASLNAAVIRRDPDFGRDVAKLIDVLKTSGINADQAVGSSLASALRKDPSLAAAVERLGTIPADTWNRSSNYGALLDRAAALVPLETIQRLADLGEPNASALICAAYQHGLHGFPKDPFKWANYAQVAAEKGQPLAEVSWAYCLDQGIGVAPNKMLSGQLYKSAADKGNMYGIFNLGCCYRDGGSGLPIDLSEAARLFRRAADLGLPEGANTYGWALLNGLGVRANRGDAIKYFKIAAKAGDSLAKQNLKDLKVWGY